MEYTDKLKDPRWQKRRLEVLERAEWKCLLCGRKDKTLNIHHLYYQGEPWEVPTNALECLCEDCHKLRETLNEYVARNIKLIPTRQLYVIAKFFSDGEELEKRLGKRGTSVRGVTGEIFGQYFEIGMQEMAKNVERWKKENPTAWNSDSKILDLSNKFSRPENNGS